MKLSKKLNENTSKSYEDKFDALNKKINNLSSEIKKIKGLEDSLFQHEIILARKIRDMNIIEKKLDEKVSKHELDRINKHLKKIDYHEELLFENTKFMKELVREIDKIKASHKITRNFVMGGGNVERKEFDEKVSLINDSLKIIKKINSSYKKKADKDKINSMKQELHERISQLEYQNKLLMKYLKKLDENKS